MEMVSLVPLDYFRQSIRSIMKNTSLSLLCILFCEFERDVGQVETTAMLSNSVSLSLF